MSLVWMFFGGFITFGIKPESLIPALYIGSTWSIVVSTVFNKMPPSEKDHQIVSSIAGYR